MKFRTFLLWTLFGLTIAFVLTYTITYTFDLRYYTNTVRLVTASRIALLAVSVIYLWTVRENLPRLLDGLSLTAAGIIVVGAISGLFNDSDWASYLRHGFQYACLLVFYLVGRDLACREIPKAVFTVLLTAILGGYTVATILYAATPGLQSGSYSFQPNLALLPLAYNGPALMSAASALLIVIGNKRAIFIGACFCIAALIVIFFERRRGGLSLPVRTFATFALTLTIAVTTVSILSTVKIPLLGMVATRISSQPSFIDTDTNSRMADLMPRTTDSKSPAGPNTGAQRKEPINRKEQIARKEEFTRKEATVSTMVRWTGARNVEVEAIWQLLNSRPLGFLIGAGFGSGFEMDYISPNDYERVNYPRDQADVMPSHVAMTSGWPLSLLFTAVIVVAYWRMFFRLDALPQMDRTFALFALSLFLDVMLGFNGTNAVAWCSIGYATMRSLNPGFVAK
jgi:hypothetical protein